MSGLSRTEKVVLGIAILGVVVLAWVGTKMVGLIRSGRASSVIEAVRVAYQSQSAPGAAELKELGCGVVVISSFDRMAAIEGFRLQDEWTAQIDPATRFVTCHSPTGRVPSCGMVARRFHS